MNASERVKAGAALLDEKVPGWRDRINPDTLTITSSNYCILGQLYGNFGAGVAALNIEGEQYGFEAVYSGKTWESLTTCYEDLQSAWEQELS